MCIPNLGTDSDSLFGTPCKTGLSPEITFIEAASYGKPSIGGIYGGEGDAIKSGQTGYLCNGNDLNAIYDTLIKILTNNQFKELGANALEFSKDFSWEKIVKKYISLI